MLPTPLVPCLFVIFVKFGILQVKSDSPPLVNIPSLGGVRGSRMLSSAARDFLAFRGIPYAEPPIGQLRFQDPVAVKPWIGRILDASQEGPKCTQYNVYSDVVLGVEDCLKLNVYTHDVNKRSRLRPVMVWIHGGSFNEGSGNGVTDKFGPGYLMDRDIVLVTINYRLEALGFLSTEDSEAPGNYGLLDQSLALNWVREHIRNFGGDPEAVTIFGESAGATSIELQILSPRSKGLFQRAIAQSGSTLCAWAVTQNNGYYTKSLAQHLNCSLTSSSEIISCLREKPAQDLVSFRKTILVLELYPLTFTARIDAEREFPFLPDDPRKLIRWKRFNHVPFITGVTANEGAFGVASLLSNDGFNLKIFKSDPIKYIRYPLGIERRDDGYQIAQRVNDHYFDGNKQYEDQLLEMEQMFSDFWFFGCIQESVNMFSIYSDHPTFYYHYAHRSQYTLSTLMGAPTDVDLGVCHCDELYMMFPNKYYPSLVSSDDKKVSKMLLDLWTSFAADGIPRSETVINGWLPMEKGQTRYLDINAVNPSMVNHSMPFQDRLPFWDDVFHSGKDEL